MGKANSPIDTMAYSSTVRRVFNTDSFGKTANLETDSIIFAATTTGAVNTHKIATITGVVAMSIFAKVDTTVTITAGATIEVGTATTTAGLIALTAGDALDIGELWHDAAPDATVELTSVLIDNIVSEDVNYKISTQTITGGAVTFYIRWSPISLDGNVELV